MHVYRQEKKRLKEFLDRLSTESELYVPTNQDVCKFEVYSDFDKIYLEKNTYFPIKEHFFRKHEVLFTFKGQKITVPAMNSPKKTFFGLRKCDLNAVKHQDSVFMGQIKDPYYSTMRNNTLLIGYHCNTAPSPYCFCGSLDLADYHDLMFYDKKDHFLVEVGSEKGQSVIDAHRDLFFDTVISISKQEKYIPGSERLDKKDLSKFYDHPDWKKGVDICLSCAACTNLCPTCYCFEVHDEVSTKSLDEGSRKRQWSSCQLPEFTKVAGEHVFRSEREQRFKHRIYHQLEYFKEKNGVNLCTGWGRCIDGCPTKIDFVQIINDMK